MSILNQMVSARIQLIIAVKVSKLVRKKGWDDDVREHLVDVVYCMKNHFTVISENVHIIPED